MSFERWITPKKLHHLMNKQNKIVQEIMDLCHDNGKEGYVVHELVDNSNGSVQEKEAEATIFRAKAKGIS